MNRKRSSNWSCWDETEIRFWAVILHALLFQLLENEIFKFEEQICDWEEELAGELPDEARENVLLVVGLAKLLIAQKLTQFRGLCDKNIVSFVLLNSIIFQIKTSL